jgi:hypothetical protein
MQRTSNPNAACPRSTERPLGKDGPAPQRASHPRRCAAGGAFGTVRACIAGSVVAGRASFDGDCDGSPVARSSDAVVNLRAVVHDNRGGTAWLRLSVCVE